MKRIVPFLVLLLGQRHELRAALLAPEELLPADTTALVTVPDWSKARAAYGAHPLVQLWCDPAMQPFREKLVSRFNADVRVPLERELGFQWSEFAGLAQGQVTLALFQNGSNGTANPFPAWCLVMDTGPQSEALTNRLADVRKKWAESGRKLTPQKIQGVEFVTVGISTADVRRVMAKLWAPTAPAAQEPATADPVKQPSAKIAELFVGQSESLLLVGNSAPVLERILLRQSGGPGRVLRDEPAFAGEATNRLRSAVAYGWVNFKPLADTLLLQAAAADATSEGGASGVPMPKWSKILAATGLTGIETLALSLHESVEGSLAEFTARVPAAARSGLLKVVELDAKDSSAPAFVPADVRKFERMRLDVPKAWATLERTATDVFPQAAGVLNMLLQGTGQVKEWDLKTEVLGSLGDDLITLELAPRTNALAELNSPPAVYLVGSTNGGKLVHLVKAVTLLLPQPLTEFKERQFQGRSVFLWQSPAPRTSDGRPGTQRVLSFAATDRYALISTDDAALEACLRTDDPPAKALGQADGFAAAVEKVGGAALGLLGYENEVETMRVTVESLRCNPGSAERMLNLTPLAALPEVGGRRLTEWFDFSLLPPFDPIARYFHFSVHAAGFTGDGFTYRLFSPRPPQLKN
jgi:hypothetical protein